MARSKIPGPLERRHLLEKDLGKDQALAIAEAYLAEERHVEAVDFLAIAEAAEPLAELRIRAVGDGNVFLLRAVAAAQEEAPTQEEWERTAAAAESAGFDAYAEEARRYSERGPDA
ncbi:MAG: hypothetical protein AAF430_17240 [Myxococcota bacterium]